MGFSFGKDDHASSSTSQTTNNNQDLRQTDNRSAFGDGGTQVQLGGVTGGVLNLTLPPPPSHDSNDFHDQVAAAAANQAAAGSAAPVIIGAPAGTVAGTSQGKWAWYVWSGIAAGGLLAVAVLVKLVRGK